MNSPQEPVTELLNRSLAGDHDATEQVFRQLWGEVRQLAARQLYQERDEHTWAPSDLANECFLRLLGNQKPFRSRQQFFAAASTIMQRLLVDYARRRGAQKRPTHLARTPLEACHQQLTASGVDCLDLAEALNRLNELSPRQAQAIRLRYFANMTWKEIAGALGVSESQARKDAVNGEAYIRRLLSLDNEA